ncbi:MAG: hypothetical protein BWY66_01866 [bacterium ADurb.Bin374]|nr:MAG: hypothetical protein BWY66_01866 [bacterium ADurb.Bin374]
MRDHRDDIAGAALFQGFCGFGDSAERDREIIDDDGVLSRDGADHFENPSILGVALPRLVADDGLALQKFGYLAGALRVAGVGGNDDEIGDLPFRQKLGQHVPGMQMVEGNPEETLDLRAVQIDRDDPVRARPLEGIGADPGSYRDAGFL